MAGERGAGAEPRLAYYIVFLMDILGQKEALQSWARLPEGGQVTPDLITALKGTVGKVLGYRDHFEQFFSQFEREPRSGGPLSRLPDDQGRRFLRMRECHVARQQFSDTFIFYTPVVNDHGDVSTSAIHQVLTAAASTLLTGLAAKAPIRGAITVGAGMQIENNNFYGPALAEAHAIESEVAAYPRVVLSQAAVDLVRRTSGFSQDQEIDRVSAGYNQQHVLPLTTEDLDGQVIVDFLGHEIHSAVSDQREIVNAVGRAYRFVLEEARRFALEADEKHSARYSRLLAYIESRLSIWGMERVG